MAERDHKRLAGTGDGELAAGTGGGADNHRNNAAPSHWLLGVIPEEHPLGKP
jgi:hypothetical protein